MANITFTFTTSAGITFNAYASGKFAKVENGKTKNIKAAEYNDALVAYDAEQAAKNKPADNKTDTPKDDGTDNKTEGTPEPKTDTPKAKTHPTADAFLARIPKDTYIFRTNNKGHILISKADGDKTAYARIRPLKDGAWIFPGKELKATREDWEYHKGWANEYALKVTNWDEVATVLNLEKA